MAALTSIDPAAQGGPLEPASDNAISSNMDTSLAAPAIDDDGTVVPRPADASQESSLGGVLGNLLIISGW